MMMVMRNDSKKGQTKQNNKKQHGGKRYDFFGILTAGLEKMAFSTNCLRLRFQILDTWKLLQKLEMRRGSIKKSSNFKIQAEKSVFRNYLDNVEDCKTALLYPDMKDVIKTTSQVIYQSCYSYSDDSPFVKGLNYGYKSFGFSPQSGPTVIYKQWLPDVSQAYIYGDFNNFDLSSHKLERVEDEEDTFQIEIDMEKEKLIQESRIMLRLIDKQGKEYSVAPPSCQARSGEFGVFCMDLSIPKSKHAKKQQILLGYTLDLKQIPLEQAEKWIEDNEESLSDFNTIIIRNLFQFTEVLKRSCLEINQMKHFYDLINCIKDRFGFKIIIEWAFAQNFDQPPSNPIENNLLKKNPDNGKWVYNFQKKEIFGFYLSKLSYYLSTFLVDGFHFKEIDAISNTYQGQILLKFISIMHTRLLDNSFALASCKVQIPGMNQPILEGGLGFAFTYNYGQDFLSSESHKELKEKFDNILGSSNCVPINLNNLNKKHLLNFIFGVLVSQKGVFCKGKIEQHGEILKKILRVRKQYQLFNTPAHIITITDKIIYLKRGRTHIVFNFSNEEVSHEIEEIDGRLQILFSSDDESTISGKGNTIRLTRNSCSVLEQIFDE